MYGVGRISIFPEDSSGEYNRAQQSAGPPFYFSTISSFTERLGSSDCDPTIVAYGPEFSLQSPCEKKGQAWWNMFINPELGEVETGEITRAHC